jgi:hypothetical protein
MPEQNGNNAPMATLFEVHTLKGGKWMVDSTYPDRESAIEVAKSLHGEKRFEGVKVIKDMFDPKTNASKEIVIYDTSKPLTDRTPSPPKDEKAAPAKPEKKAEVDFKGSGPPRKQAAAKGSPLTKVVMLICVLLLTGAILLFAAGHMVEFVSKL